MTWTPQQAEQAQAEGWRLADTIDNGTSHVYLTFARAASGTGFKNDHAAGLYVVRRARENSSFHQAALRAVMQSRMNIKPKRRS